MFLDDVRPGSPAVEKGLLVLRDDRLAGRRPRELLAPGQIRGPIGEDELGDDVEVDRLVLDVELVTPHEVAALVADGRGRQAANQRHVVMLVVVDEGPRLDLFPLAEESHDLEHAVAPATWVGDGVHANSGRTMRRPTMRLSIAAVTPRAPAIRNAGS